MFFPECHVFLRTNYDCFDSVYITNSLNLLSDFAIINEYALDHYLVFVVVKSLNVRDRQ